MSLLKNIISKYSPPHHEKKDNQYPQPLTCATVSGIFDNCADFECRDIYFGGERKHTATLFYVDGLISSSDVSQLIVQPLTDVFRLSSPGSMKECIDLIIHGVVFSCTMKERTTLDDVVSDLTQGYATLVFDDEQLALSFEAKTTVYRAVNQPSEEKSVKGAKDAFVENIRINTSLVRRKLFNPSLKLHQTVAGRKSRTTVAVMYVDGIANPEYYEELIRRIDAIDVDGMLTTASLEEYIVDKPSSPFPQLIYTERPDKFALNLLEGRVGIIVDGIPLGFLAPATLPQFIKVPGDSSHNYIVSTILTMLRYFGMILSLLLPGLYVATSLYHQEMIPTKLLISVVDSKQQVPFSSFVEIFAMLLAFELLQEAGLRLPDPIGQTVSIIGALIVGQSAVEARVVSPIAVIVVALAGISGYTCPNDDLGSVLRISRMILVFAALAGGMFGIMCAFAMLLWHMASIDSLGVSYLNPLSEGRPFTNIKALARLPLKMDNSRDAELKTPDKRSKK